MATSLISIHMQPTVAVKINVNDQYIFLGRTIVYSLQSFYNLSDVLMCNIMG